MKGEQDRLLMLAEATLERTPEVLAAAYQIFLVIQVEADGFAHSITLIEFGIMAIDNDLLESLFHRLFDSNSTAVVVAVVIILVLRVCGHYSLSYHRLMY